MVKSHFICSRKQGPICSQTGGPEQGWGVNDWHFVTCKKCLLIKGSERNRELQDARKALDWDWIADLLVPAESRDRVASELQMAYLAGCPKNPKRLRRK